MLVNCRITIFSFVFVFKSTHFLIVDIFETSVHRARDINILLLYDGRTTERRKCLLIVDIWRKFRHFIAIDFGIYREVSKIKLLKISSTKIFTVFGSIFR